MNADWFEFVTRVLVALLFAAMIISTSYYSYVTLVKGWVGKPPVQTLSRVIVAATLSMLVVLVLKYAAGDVDIELSQLKFKGAAGPVFLWIFCFIALVWGFSRLSRQGSEASQSQEKPNA